MSPLRADLCGARCATESKKQWAKENLKCPGLMLRTVDAVDQTGRSGEDLKAVH